MLTWENYNSPANVGNEADFAYLQLLKNVRELGHRGKNRTGIDDVHLIGCQLRFDLNKGFPLLTTKRIHFKSVLHELIWFLSGSGNIQYLKDNGVSIWDEWADENGDLGPVYGVQWRKWKKTNVVDSGLNEIRLLEVVYIDQIKNLINEIKSNPSSRRLIVSSWNVADLPLMKLAPCAHTAQFIVTDGKLDCVVTQRSADLFLGVPFNIASYATLTHMIAQVCGLKVGELIWNGGHVHIYENHFDQVDEQLKRFPRPLPELKINPLIKDIDDFKFEDFEVLDYNPHPSIKAPIAV